MSTQPCGCDPTFECLPGEVVGWKCAQHRRKTLLKKAPDELELANVPPFKETTFTIKDSGERKQFDSGMVRDTTTDKIDYSLALDGPMFGRLAEHLTKGAKKYAKRNWMQANGQEELDRFRESALRHFLQWFQGETDEDHAAAVLFNVNGAEYVKGRMK